MTCKIAGHFFYPELCIAFRNKHLALRSLNPSDRRCYDLYVFIFGVYHLVLPPRSLFLFWIHGTLAYQKFPSHLGMLPTCVRAGFYRRFLFHPCRDLRHPNPRLLCPHLRSYAFPTRNPWRSFVTTSLSITWVHARRRDSPSIALWLTTTASA